MTQKFVLINHSVEPPFIMCSIGADLKRTPIVIENRTEAVRQRDAARFDSMMKIDCYQLVRVDEAPLSSFSQGMIWSHNEKL